MLGREAVLYKRVESPYSESVQLEKYNNRFIAIIMNALTFLAIVALASAAVAEDAQATKKQDKRGLLGLGYGGYPNHGFALDYGYTGGLGHDYVAAAPTYSVNHAAPVVSAVSHGISSVPIAPAAHIPVGYAHGSGYSGYSGIGLGHGLAYGHGW